MGRSRFSLRATQCAENLIIGCDLHECEDEEEEEVIEHVMIICILIQMNTNDFRKMNALFRYLNSAAQNPKRFP